MIMVEEQLENLRAELREHPEDRRLLVQVARLLEMDQDLGGARDCLERAAQLALQDADSPGSGDTGPTQPFDVPSSEPDGLEPEA